MYDSIQYLPAYRFSAKKTKEGREHNKINYDSWPPPITTRLLPASQYTKVKPK